MFIEIVGHCAEQATLRQLRKPFPRDRFDSIVCAGDLTVDRAGAAGT